jgi:deazaflavin-dependent oxidoreductase (nitroreductase family)
MMMTTERYLRPGFFTQHLFNPVFKGLTRVGISVRGSHILAVRGRTSGEWRTVPVNPLELDGQTYLVAPRGHTEWVRNIRAAGGGELRLGRRVTHIEVVELADDAKPTVIREYLRRWKAEVGAFFEGIDEASSDEELLAVAPGFPVFRVR